MSRIAQMAVLIIIMIVLMALLIFLNLVLPDLH